LSPSGRTTFILTSSFKLNEIIHKNLNYHKSNLSGLKIFKQNQGMHLSDILEQFKNIKMHQF